MSDILADSIDGLIVNEFAILLYQSNKYHSQLKFCTNSAPILHQLEVN
jgi:hypothetical protein